MSPRFRKRTFTLPSFGRSLLLAGIRLPRLSLALIRPATSRALREQVMLATTSVNDCRYCSWAHTHLALEQGVDLEALNQLLGNPDASTLGRPEAIAILFAQQFAERQARDAVEGKDRLKEEYSAWQRSEIMAYLHVIYFANLSGNTFDALLARLKGYRVEESQLMTEVIVSLLSFPVLIPIMLSARNDRKVGFGTL